MNLWLGLSYCDGKWNKVILKKGGLVVSASVNELKEHVVEPGLDQLFVNSPVYIGGIPDEVQNVFKKLGLEQGMFLQGKETCLQVDSIYCGSMLSSYTVWSSRWNAETAGGELAQGAPQSWSQLSRNGSNPHHL